MNNAGQPSVRVAQLKLKLKTILTETKLAKKKRTRKSILVSSALFSSLLYLHSMSSQSTEKSNIQETITVQDNPTHKQEQKQEKQSKQVQEAEEEDQVTDEDLHKLLLPDVSNLPIVPPSSIETNFVSYFAPDFMKPGHDQYVYRHANGLCVIGLAPTHVAFKDEGGITAVDFNVGKSDRSGFKVTGKRKKNAQHFESNTALCKVCTRDASYIVRCCVKGSLLEVNDKLIKQPGLLNSSADREGYTAIMMPKPGDWLKIKSSLLTLEEYKKLREGR
ncbi:protein Abitram isoform X2 [Ricinus communis]|nr:protein Abitram isoform X2 [Ricinus communis]